jgi:hypothetical protein
MTYLSEVALRAHPVLPALLQLQHTDGVWATLRTHHIATHCTVVSPAEQAEEHRADHATRAVDVKHPAHSAVADRGVSHIHQSPYYPLLALYHDLFVVDAVVRAPGKLCCKLVLREGSQAQQPVQGALGTRALRGHLAELSLHC